MKFKLISIDTIEKKQYVGKVYDLAIANTHSYNIRGISVHNSVCETKTETGVHMPTLQSIEECYEYKIHMERDGGIAMPQIIADGGIRVPSDLNKAIAVGADVAFCGSIFAGTSESPGNVINIDGELLKLYRGAASFGVQVESLDHEPDYVEGRESMVKYKPGGVSKVVKRFRNGLRSAMSYMDARTIKEFRENVSVEKI
jgi:IMP dehydrogenase